MNKKIPLANVLRNLIIGGSMLTLNLWAENHPSLQSLPLRDAVTIEGIRAHQYALQKIAENNDGNRMAITDGYKASVDYVHNQLEQAGYLLARQDFPIFLSEDRNPPQLMQIRPDAHVFIAGVDFVSMSSEGTIRVEAPIFAVDLVVPSQRANHSTSGCEESDFRGFLANSIALIQRGTCSFLEKITNAKKAGALGVIIFNEGNPGRTGVVESRVSDGPKDYPVLSASFFVGELLRAGKLHGSTGSRVSFSVDVERTAHNVQNLIAETKDGNENRVLVVGAHLDSVRHGPGMNDNGSGSAAILEIALKIAQLKLPIKNKLRFMWFGAEEFGLLGSEYYVSSLNKTQKNKIMAMLNFDMLGSSNYVRFVYDGDSSRAPAGSAQIEKIFLDYFSSIGLASHPTSFDGRSDYGPFIEQGIPAGGLFSGAEGRKSAELARIYGGEAGKSFDPCYHRACDDFAHTGDQNGSLALKSLDELSDAAAHSVLVLANKDAPLAEPHQRTKTMFDFSYKGHVPIK